MAKAKYIEQRKPSEVLMDSLSGLPSEVRHRWKMLMLQVCIDDSGSDLQGPVYVLAGYLAEAEEWAKFSDEWQRALQKPPAISYFKLSEANRLNEGGQFAGWTRRDADDKIVALSKVIAPHVKYHIATVIAQADYDEIVMPFRKVLFTSPHAEDHRMANVFKTPYYLAFYDVITDCIKSLLGKEPLEDIEFYFDDQGLMGRRVAGFWDNLKAETPPQYSRYLTNPPQFKDEKKFLPLQAADMIAGLTAGRFADMLQGIDLIRPPLYHLRNVPPLWSVWGKQRLTQFLENYLNSRSEYEKFDHMMKQLIRVPHSIVKAKLDAEKAIKRSKKRNPKKPSASGHANGEKH